jgi:hypothetical protein
MTVMVLMLIKENGIIIGAGVLSIRAARRFLSKIAPKSFDDAEMALLSQIIGLMGLDGLILTCIKVLYISNCSLEFIWNIHHGAYTAPFSINFIYHYFLGCF